MKYQYMYIDRKDGRLACRIGYNNREERVYMPRYSHRERLEMIVAGERPDRFAASFWRHYFHMEHHAEGTVEAMLHFQKEFDWDFMKINPRADFHIEDWGFRHQWSHDEFTKHTKISFPINRPEDWAKIEVISPTAPSLAEHLKVVSMIRHASDKELPILMTLFSPLSIAGRMVPERPMLVEHIRSHPELVLRALKAITATFVAYASELRNAGADGLFFATLQWASSNLLTWEEYQQFGVPFDLEVMRATEGDAINLLHICDSNCYLRELMGEDYPAQIYNWDSDHPTNPPISEGLDLITSGAIVGGIDQNGWLLHSDPDEIGYQMERLKDENDPSRLIIGPGCVVDPKTSAENLRTIREKL